MVSFSLLIFYGLFVRFLICSSPVAHISATLAKMADPILPDFDSLPVNEGAPQPCAWGLFDKNGKKDHLGCLNLLTPTVVKEALTYAREGVSISLNWSLNALRKPLLGRNGFQHSVIHLKESLGIHAFDDEVFFNTQGSSQWDSLAHWAHQDSGLHYNGVRITREDILQPYGSEDVTKAFPTINHWHDRGGLLGRGVLLDYHAYAEANGIRYSPFEKHSIPVSVLEDVAKYQSTKFKHGDILLIRMGYTEGLASAASDEEQHRLASTHAAVGLETSKVTARWIWNHHFTAVACDALGLEAVPPVPSAGETLSKWLPLLSSSSNR